jgi:hypothetical protein
MWLPTNPLAPNMTNLGMAEVKPSLADALSVSVKVASIAAEVLWAC